MRRSHSILVAVFLTAIGVSTPGKSEARRMGSGSAGRVSIRNSCRPSAQQPLESGLLALHNFEFEEAQAFFKQARIADPHCAMAGWGEAMSYWNPLSGVPDARAIAAGKEAVRFAVSAEARATSHECKYVEAIAEYYAASGGTSGADAYTSRMHALHTSFPEDHEATLFYALALIATEPDQKIARLAQARKAGSLIESVFRVEPWNPGAAHYLIHAYDEPELAEMALPAARAYTRLAPNSPHALHMPSHIFAQLGLWREAINSNLASYNAAHNNPNESAQKIQEQLHALDFVQYAQLQLEELEAARQTTALIVQIADAHPSRGTEHARYGISWRFFIETNDWHSIQNLPAPDALARPFWHAAYCWVQTVAAGELHQPPLAAEWLAKYISLMRAVPLNDNEDDSVMLQVMLKEALAWNAFSRARHREAIDFMRAAVEDEKNPLAGIYPRKPALEMLGDLELDAGAKAEAAVAYRQSLREHRRRRLSEIGLQRAQEGGRTLHF